MTAAIFISKSGVSKLVGLYLCIRKISVCITWIEWSIITTAQNIVINPIENIEIINKINVLKKEDSITVQCSDEISFCFVLLRKTNFFNLFLSLCGSVRLNLCMFSKEFANYCTVASSRVKFKTRQYSISYPVWNGSKRFTICFPPQFVNQLTKNDPSKSFSNRKNREENKKNCVKHRVNRAYPRSRKR